MASPFLSCPIRQVLVHVYPGSSKGAGCFPVVVPIGRSGKPVQKPQFMPMRRAKAIALKLATAQVGTVSML
jgi:hypothetical protein